MFGITRLINPLLRKSSYMIDYNLYIQPEVNDILYWIYKEYHDFHVIKTIEGSYGLIFILKHPHTADKTALKTINPKLVFRDGHFFEKDLKNLKRELRLWADLKPHYNTIHLSRTKSITFPLINKDTTLGETILESRHNASRYPDGLMSSHFGYYLPMYSDKSELHITFPILQMKACEGSLDEWVGSDIPYENKLMALIQAMNGLRYLYKQGLEGHGDLKTNNFLYYDFSEGNNYKDNYHLFGPIKPYIVKVADFGCSDIWLEQGKFDMAWRQYRSPERIKEKRFVPVKSDIWSFGMIMSELLQGRLPGSKKIKDSDGKFLKWVEDGERYLDEIKSVKVKQLIKNCLEVDPEKRPSPNNIIDLLCGEVMSTTGYDPRPTIDLWNNGVTRISHIAQGEEIVDETELEKALRILDNARKKIIISAEDLANELSKIEDIFLNYEIMDLYSVEVALEYYSFIEEYNKESTDISLDISNHFEKFNFMLKYLAKFEPFHEKLIKSHEHSDEITCFERLGRVNFQIEEYYSRHSWPYSQDLLMKYSQSSKVFYESIKLYSFGHEQKALILLDKAIDLYSDEAVLYYYRAKWNYEIRLEEALDNNEEWSPPLNSNEQNDLLQAISLEPEWELPRKEIKTLPYKFNRD